MLPSPAELTYFMEVANTLNVSRASERLGISQPSLSLAIKRLEQSIGALLFIRQKQGVTLTQAGKQLQLHTRELLHYWEKTKSEALASHTEIQGYFTLGCHSSVAIYAAPKFLPDLLESYPRLEIHLKNDISRKITEQVINLSIDIGLVVNPIAHPDLVIRKLCADEVGFWVGEGNKTIQNIHSPQSVILCVPELAQTQFLLKKAKQAGIHSERIMTVSSMEVVANLTANGCGIGILPARVAQSVNSNLRRVLNTPTHPDEVCLIYRNENRNVQAIQTIASFIKKSFEANLD